MSNLKKLFYKHDAVGFEAFLSKVAAGTATISGAAMTPAVLLLLAQSASGVEEEVIKLQWKALVQSILENGSLSECIAVADVSGSMMSPRLADKTTPLHSFVALSILIAQVTKAPFNNAIISFTDRPHFIDLVPDTTLTEMYYQIEREGTGYSTDFIAVFRQILSRAKAAKLAPESMIKKVFVFSDMEFDSCQSSYSGRSYATHHEIVKGEFETAGYELSEMIFWNLAHGRGKTLKATRADVPRMAMISGYSAAMVKVFLDGGDFEDEEEFEEVQEDGTTKTMKKEMTPLDVMKKAVYHPSFAGLKVYD